MVHLQSTPGRTCVINGEEFLFFSGYSYLGMSHVKEFTDLVKEGIDRYGWLFPSSRISNTRLTLYEEFEKELSQLTGMEETVSFSSGFLAGNAIASLLSSHKNILIAPGTHPAITINIHNRNINNRSSAEDFIYWAKKITDAVNSSPDNDFVLMCDSVNVLNSTVNDLSFLKNISLSKRMIVLIDHSHGIALTEIGEQHSVLNWPEADNIEYIVSYSLSKALNLQGGAVSCSKHFAGKLKHHPAYTASTAINPALLHAYLNGKNLYSSQRKHLAENIAYLNNKNVPSTILNNTPPLPVFVCCKENSALHFYNNKMIISSFSYPYSASDKIERIIISALHTQADINKLCALL